MNFVISNVTTVEEDEDEPLYEVKKVSIFKEKKECQIEPQSKVRVTTYKKSCYVPLCPNSSVATPEKMFITVPVNPVRRKLWLDAVGKTNGKNPKSPMFCCQDHFNLRKDMKNYEEHVRRGKVQMLLHQTVVPHSFICNQYGHLKRKERLAMLKKLEEEGCLDPSKELEEEEGYETSIADKNVEIIKTPRPTKRRKVDQVKLQSNRTVFIEMPAFEYDDKPEYVEIKENGVETILIEDSDPEER